MLPAVASGKAEESKTIPEPGNLIGVTHGHDDLPRGRAAHATRATPYIDPGCVDRAGQPPTRWSPGVFCMRRARLLLAILIIIAASSVPAWAAGRTIVDQAGRTVTVPDNPARIISLAPNITEIIFAVGAGDKIVGVSEYSDYPPEAAGIPQVGSYIKPNLEAIIALKPDLVIATADGEKRVEINRLAALGIAVYIINPKTIAGVVATVREIGLLTGRAAEAEETARAMEERIERVRARVAGLPRVSTLLVLNTNPLITVNGNTFQDEMMTAAGGRNIASAERIRYPTLTYEEVVVRAPEVIIMTTMSPDENYRTVAAGWARFNTVPAVKTGRIFVIDSDIVDRPSPRMVQGLEELARLLHPEAFLPGSTGGR